MMSVLVSVCTVLGQGDGHYRLELAEALPGGRALGLLLDAKDGKVVSAFGLGRKYNGRGHTVDAAGLKVTDGKIAGAVAVTVLPDPWVPSDHKERLCKLELDVALRDGQATGSYAGTYSTDARKGGVTGEKLSSAGVAGRYRLRLFQALRASAPTPWWGGGNNTYAIDMWLSFRIDERGKAIDPQLESPVPDYRRYSALVDSIDIQFDGCAFSGTVVADVDSGEQGKARGECSRRERYTYDLAGMAIGNDVVGRYDGKVRSIHDRDIPFLGSIDRDEPPSLDSSSVFMRLHDAMQNEYPTLLYLSVGDPKNIHGLAYVSGYNHQPQAVDCSKLVRDGNRFHGPMTVSVYPDCYHSKDVFFDINYELDATVRRGVVNGSFKGEDRGEKTKGRITGELRAKKPPVAALDGLAACELSVGWGMPGTKTPSFLVRYELQKGKVVKTTVIAAKRKQPLDATLSSSDLRLNGDELAATVVFDLTGQGTKKYEYSFSATVNGDRCGGFWRGKCNGEDILVKSSKLGGRLIAKE